MAKNHTPLIEAIPGDNRSSLVTFVWQAKEATRNVLIFGGFTLSDLAANQMIRLGATDLWYKTYRLRNDARFIMSSLPTTRCNRRTSSTPRTQWARGSVSR